MNPVGPLALVSRLAAILDDLEIPCALGGSVGSSFFGEPRATAKVDVAISLDVATGERLIERARAEFCVPVESARIALRARQSFNLLATEEAFKVDLFVLGDGLLDRRQIQRRVLVQVPGAANGLWVTSSEDQVLRKLDWYRQGGSTSDRQWRDVIGLLMVGGEDLDLAYLNETAAVVDLTCLLDRALADVAGSG